jgi:diguanylate cyclase (GGDEF)-like protein
MSLQQDSEPSPTAQPLALLRLRIYAFLIPIGLAAIMALWFTGLISGSLTAFHLISLPSVAAVFICFAVLIHWRADLLAVIEPLSFVLLYAYQLAELYEALAHNFSPIGAAVFPHWLPLASILAGLIFSNRRAVAASVFFYCLLLVPGVIALRSYGAAFFLAPVAGDLLEIYGLQAIYIPLSWGIAVLRERYLAALNRTEVLARAAELDYLTSVYNRRHLARQLDREMSRTVRNEQPLAAILVDIDRFKEFNDTHGHMVGDQVLIGFSELIQQNLRIADMFGRWGGEEFLILAPSTNLLEATALAERLCLLIAEASFGTVQGVTASFGVTVYCPEDTADSFVNRADAALYRAKQRGRNRVEFVGCE